MTRFFPSSEGVPSNSPDATITPGATWAASIVAPSSFSPSAGWMTTWTGSRYFRANAKSRSSCAGTAITAPVPYSTSTKFATHTGTRAPVSGFSAYAPVKTPSFS
jgi:hypothetical protein